MLRATRDCGIGDVKAFEHDCLPLLSANQSQISAIASSQEIIQKPPTKEDRPVNAIEDRLNSVAIAERTEEANLPNLLSDKVQASNLIQIQHLNRPEDR